MINIGIIGAGRIAHVHARSIAAHPGATLAIVADPAQEAAAAIGAEFSVPYTTSVKEVMADENVDAVIICSPTPYHVEHVLAAHRAGKPALCEKPIASTLAEATELADELGGTGAKVMVGFNRRFDPSFAHIKNLVDNGEIGDVEQVTITSRDPNPPTPEYMASSGGIFKDMTIHDFDMARFLLGEIHSVYALGQNLDPALAESGDFDGAIIVLTNAEGRAATIINSRHCSTGYDQRLEVFGNKASATADNVRPTTVRFSTSTMSDAQDPYLDFFLDRYTEAYARELDAFLTYIETPSVQVPGVHDGVEALRIAEAAAESARTHQPVEL